MKHRQAKKILRSGRPCRGGTRRRALAAIRRRALRSFRGLVGAARALKGTIQSLGEAFEEVGRAVRKELLEAGQDEDAGLCFDPSEMASAAAAEAAEGAYDDP